MGTVKLWVDSTGKVVLEGDADKLLHEFLYENHKDFMEKFEKDMIDDFNIDYENAYLEKWDYTYEELSFAMIQCGYQTKTTSIVEILSDVLDRLLHSMGVTNTLGLRGLELINIAESVIEINKKEK